MKKISIALASIISLAIFSTSTYAWNGSSGTTDRAMDLLGAVFGDYFTLNAATAGPVNQMFGAFNLALCVVASWLLIWAIISGTISTAHKGEWLGGKYDALWMPIRHVWGIAGVMPIAGGFCLAQLLMYGAAATGVTKVANPVAAMGYQAIITSASDQPILSVVVLSQDTTMQALLKAQTCAIAYNSQYYDAAGQPLVDGAPPAFTLHTTDVARADAAVEGITAVDHVISYGGTGQYDYPQDYCGGVTIPAGAGGEVSGVGGPLLSQKEVRDTHAAALSKMAAELQPISEALYYQHKRPNPATLASIRNGYNATVKKAISSVISHNSQTTQQILAANGMTDQNHSWIELGFIFNKLAQVHREIHAAINVTIDPRQALVTSNDMAAQRASHGLALANAYIAQSDPGQRAAESVESTEGGGKLEWIMRKIEFSLIQKALQGFVLGQDDLLTGMTNFGYTSLSVLWAGVGLIFGTASFFGILSAAAGNAIIAWATLLLLGPIAFCLMCAFYLPMLPFIYWWGGIIQWVITVAEGIVAAPIWMVAHLDLDGDGMGQRSERGYLFVLDLLLRPALMTLGLVLGWMISNALGSLLKYALVQWYFSGSGNTSSIPIIGTGLAGIVQFFGVIILFGYLGLLTLKHCYSLINILPDQAMVMIGRAAQSVGGNIEQTVHSDMGGVAGKAGGEVTQATRQRMGPSGGGIKPSSGEN